MNGVSITSEIGPLQAVLTHRPGRELLAVTPSNREHYLYDDIIDLDLAEREHRRLTAVLQRFGTVYEVRACLADVLAEHTARTWLIDRTRNVVPSEALARRLHDLPTDELVRVLIEGAVSEPGPIARALNATGFALPPLPNLFFTRDAGMVLDRHVVIGSMRYGVRWTEELLIKVLFKHHPAFENAGILYDGSEERRHDYTLEGGDVHPLRRDLVVIGYSERSSPAALDHLCELLFQSCAVEDVIVVVMPAVPAAVHLDMIFTQVDCGLCVVHAPHFIGPERRVVLHRRRGQQQVREMPSLFAALKEVDLPLEPVFCGGLEATRQDREQWASGCNFVTVRPGVCVGYARNEATLEAMVAAGFEVVSGVDFLTGESTIADGVRAVITVPGGELVRGGGGPRCMTLPLRRGEV